MIAQRNVVCSRAVEIRSRSASGLAQIVFPLRRLVVQRKHVRGLGSREQKVCHQFFSRCEVWVAEFRPHPMKYRLSNHPGSARGTGFAFRVASFWNALWAALRILFDLGAELSANPRP